MKGERFEREIARWLEEQGFRTELTSQTNDRGVDVVAHKGGRKYAVQAKAYAAGNRVGSATVQKASGLLTRPDIDGAIVITTSSFTSEAEEVANNRGVELLSLDDQSSNQTRQRNTPQSTSVDDEFNGDPRLQRHQRQGGVYSQKPAGQNSNDEIISRTLCPNCGEKIPGNRGSHIGHWKHCGLPSERPTSVPVDIWWDIKDVLD